MANTYTIRLTFSEKNKKKSIPFTASASLSLSLHRRPNPLSHSASRARARPFLIPHFRMNIYIVVSNVTQYVASHDDVRRPNHSIRRVFRFYALALYQFPHESSSFAFFFRRSNEPKRKLNFEIWKLTHTHTRIWRFIFFSSIAAWSQLRGWQWQWLQLQKYSDCGQWRKEKRNCSGVQNCGNDVFVDDGKARPFRQQSFWRWCPLQQQHMRAKSF